MTDMTTPTTNAARSRVRVWDVPTRAFHWALAAAVLTAIVSGRMGGEWMRLHGLAGMTIGGLVVFRLVWGFVGSTHARFANFIPTPRTLKAYWQGRWQGLGHNPLGALSVVAMLALLATQAATGLFSNDEISYTGPLAAWVSDELSLRLSGLHHRIANALFVLIALHLLAIVFHVAFKRDKLIRPMLTGYKEVDE